MRKKFMMVDRQSSGMYLLRICHAAAKTREPASVRE